MAKRAAIVCTPGILGGRPRIEGTRIAVAHIAGWLNDGYDSESIVREVYEHLGQEQVEAARKYYEANRPAIAADIAEEHAAYERGMREHEQARTQPA
jgi:uncharacterized protein (DUF433 family)